MPTIITSTKSRLRFSSEIHRRTKQQGLVLMLMLTLLTLWGLNLFVGQLSATQFRSQGKLKAIAAMAEAKAALLGDAISQQSISTAGYLRLPDLGRNGFGVAAEGSASANFGGNVKDYSVLGKFPWKTLGSLPLRDENSECLWFVVSGRFKIHPVTDALNWDTLGQIDAIDGNGNVVATNLAALIIAPGPVLDGQNRNLADPAYTQCGGNYDARNYMDSYDSAHALSGEINYFTGSTNNRVASSTNTKRFVVSVSEHYNDQLLFIRSDDIFTPLIRRNDFAAALANMMSHPIFQTITISGHNGIDNLDCATAAGMDTTFCNNWKEMLFLTQQHPAPAAVTIDGAPSTACSRILLFSGRKAAGQKRNTIAEKNDRNNYLEGVNAASFNAPLASGTVFSGASTFDWRTPETDLIRCLP